MWAPCQTPHGICTRIFLPFLSLTAHSSLWPSVSTDDLLSRFTKLFKAIWCELPQFFRREYVFVCLLNKCLLGYRRDRVSGNLAGQNWEQIQQHTENCAIMDVYVKQSSNIETEFCSHKSFHRNDDWHLNKFWRINRSSPGGKNRCFPKKKVHEQNSGDLT